MFEGMGTRLKELRLKNKLSREQVSGIIGVSTSAVGLYESGERLPSLTILVRLSAAYKVSLDYITGNQPPSPPTMVSLDGLTEHQAQVVKQIIGCFKNPNM